MEITTELLSIILSIVALFVTVIGFFASLKFYRDGVELQKEANSALTKIREKSDSIQNQVGGMFEKTLDAAISKKYFLEESFDEVNEQLDASINKAVESAIKQIGNASDKEKERLKNIIENEFISLKTSIENTREDVEEITTNPDLSNFLPRSEFQASILGFLLKTGEWVSLSELSKRVGIKKSTTQRSINRLVSRNLVDKKEEGEKILYKAIINN